ncbi:D-alanyl-D-alanine carboxypeptidase family protein [Bacillus sp. EB600]|uniref:D-alanyl-D-alanine carboxypeptidase family protein n=1 Tax=Bacillus sp. EB600 TaxID=2806345 RepID=UPI0035C22DDF
MNKKFIQKSVATGLAIILFFGIFAGFNKAEADTALNVNAAGAIIVDGQTGQVLYEQNADSLLGIASMSKMMTEYILLDAIKHGRVKWDQKYSVDELAYKISQNRDLSNVPLRRDGKYKVRDLYQAMAIYSANGATIALAEVIAGSETNFLKMMNDQAKKLGIKDYKFVNSTGLNNSDYKGMQPKGTDPTAENEMSPRGVATLAFRLINDFPDVLKTASTPTKMFVEGTKMDNWNWMLPSLVYGYQGVDGLKTGTTDFAGACFTGTAMRDGKRFITVVQDTKDAKGNRSDKKSRFDETRKMLDYAFSNYTKEQIVPKHYQVKGNKTVKVANGKSKEVEIYTNTPLKAMVLNGEKKNYQPVLVLDKTKLTKNGELTAPIKKGEKVGYLTVEPKNGKKLDFLTSDDQKRLSADVVANQDVEQANWFVRMMRGIGGFFGHLFGGISTTVKGWF